MARCGCDSICSCFLEGSLGDCIETTVTGAGSELAPYVIIADIVLSPDPDNILVCTVDGLLAVTGGTTGGDAFITVAANDTPEPFKSRAAFICDGTADQTEIQSALDTYPGRQVILLPGTFNTTATILLDQNETLVGSGRETTTISYSGSDYAIRCVDPPGSANGDNTLAHMTINATAINGGCLDVEAGSSRDVFYDLDFFALGATSNKRTVFLRTGDLQFLNNRVSVAGDYLALLVSGGSAYLIKDCFFSGPVSFDNCSDLIFDGNWLSSSAASFSGLNQGGTGFTRIAIINNKFEASGQHGITLYGDDCTLINNTIRGVGSVAANTYDAIQVSGNRNIIQVNVIKGTTHRYAANILVASTDNWITNNYLLAGGTGALLDNGTATVVAAGNL